MWRHFKQYMLVAIDPKNTVHQLLQILQVKLIWKGYLTEQNKSLFLNVGNKQITTSFGSYCLKLDKEMRMLYDTYKK